MSIVRRRAAGRVPPRRSATTPVSFFSRKRTSDPAGYDSALNTPPDTKLAMATVLLMAIGMVAVYSAGPARAGDGSLAGNMLARQFLAGIIGCAAMYGCSRLSLKRVDQFTLALVGLAVLAQFLVFIPGVGATVKGATRWVRLGPLSFQPSELARLASVLYAARFAARYPELVTDWKRVWIGFGVPLIFTVLVYFQRDLDTALFMLFYAGIVYFVAGMPWFALGSGAALAVAVGAYKVWTEPYRMQRLTAFMNPEAHTQDAGYQVWQGLIGMGSGGWFGRGLGGSVQKFGFLPEAHTDFIFAVIGEEGGFLATIVVVSLFAMIAWRGYRIAFGQPIPYARYLAAGITAMVTIQALTNLLVVTSCIPVAGIPLPLVSSGGTSVVFTAAALGILWGLSRRRDA